MTRIGAIDTLSPGQVQHDATCATQPRVILVDGRVMQDSYHGIGRYTFELLLELSRHDMRLIVLYSPIKGRLDISELINRPIGNEAKPPGHGKLSLVHWID